MIRKVSLLTTIFLLTVLSSWAQDETTETFRYHVPLPESTLLGDWRFKLEVAPVEAGIIYDVALEGYDFNGRLSMTDAYRERHSADVLVWENGDDEVSRQLQSLVLVSSVELSGMLWMWNDDLQIVNGVSAATVRANRLIMPHIPSDFFTWRSSFTVQGLSDAGESGQLLFGYNYYQNLAPQFGETPAWSLDLLPDSHFTGAPFYNIDVREDGVEPAITWGSVRSPNANFELAGYQNFLSMNTNSQSATIELASEELSANTDFKGAYGFSQNDEYTFSEWFAFTNPHAIGLTIDFTLKYFPRLEDGSLSSEVATLEESHNIAAQARINMILGSNLFSEFDGEPISLKYEAHTRGLFSVTMPIYSLHLQSESESQALGAHYRHKIANRSMTTLGLSDQYETELAIFSMRSEPLDLNFKITDESGQVLLDDTFEIQPFHRRQITTQELRERLLELDENVNLDRTVRIDITTKNGDFLAKQTVYRNGDYAIANPFSIFDRPVFKRQ